MDEIKCLQDRVTLDDARYTDDTTIIAAVFERLQFTTDQLQEICKVYGMNIITEKWKHISNSTTNVTIENRDIKIVKKFKFLGSLVSNPSGNVKRRIALANSAFGRLKKVYGHAETSR